MIKNDHDLPALLNEIKSENCVQFLTTLKKQIFIS